MKLTIKQESTLKFLINKKIAEQRELIHKLPADWDKHHLIGDVTHLRNLKKELI